MMESFQPSDRRWGAPQLLTVGQPVRIIPVGQMVDDANPHFGVIIELLGRDDDRDSITFLVRHDSGGTPRIYHAADLKGL